MQSRLLKSTTPVELTTAPSQLETWEPYAFTIICSPVYGRQSVSVVEHTWDQALIAQVPSVWTFMWDR